MNKPGLEFIADKQNKTIKVKRAYAAELPLVWDAYTKSEILDQWWAPKPWKARTKLQDFKVGGRWLYAMVGPHGEEQWSVAHYKQIHDQKSFSVSDAFTDSEGNVNKDMPQSNWEVTFTSEGDKTLVEFTVTFSSAEQLQALLDTGFEEGLTSAMVNLDELLPSLKK